MSGYIAPQQPIQPQPPLQPVYQEEKGLTVCGIVGVVFGALGFVLSFIPIINNIAAIFGFIGVILAIVALVGTFRGKKRGKALAIVAAVLSVLVTFEWANNTDKNNSFAVLASPQVFQNGQALDTAIYSENPAGYDSNSDFAEVQPGATGTVTIGYTLKDDSEVTVDVTDLFDLNDSAKVVHKFTV